MTENRIIEISAEEVQRSLINALNELVNNDSYLFLNNLHERSITHKLAEYLQPLFLPYNVDCEYNRDGHDPKRVCLFETEANRDDEGSNVFPDIIIHERGNNLNNCLIIEAKKIFRADEEFNIGDRRKVEAFIRDLQYQHGAQVSLLVYSPQIIIRVRFISNEKQEDFEVTL